MVAGAAVAMTAGGATAPGSGSRTVSGIDTSLVTAPSSAAASGPTAPVAPVGPAVVHIADADSSSLVTLEPANGAGPTHHATGVVLPAGDLVATAASAVDDGEQVTVLSSDGHHLSGTVAGVDTKAGIAVVQLSRSLSPATFVDETVAPKQLALAACRCDTGAKPSSASTAPQVAVGMVRAVGTPATVDGGPALVDAIEAEVPLASAPWGAVLVDDDGGVLGILDGVRSAGGDTYGYFVPAALAVGVAEELAQDHHVNRGWLGVLCQDNGGTGAAVTTVIPGSPASAAGLRAGDVVEAVDSHVVGSLADLQARLYTLSPGTQLQLTFARNGAVATTAVTLVALPS
jgi:S1-C subfamily serine protease